MLKEKLMEDLKKSMKEKNVIRKNVVQMVRAAILQVEKDKVIELDDNKILEIIAKEAKKRKDSLADFEKAGREELVNQVKEIIEKVGATSMKDMGNVMKVAKEEIGTTADGKSINEVVKELLNN